MKELTDKWNCIIFKLLKPTEANLQSDLLMDSSAQLVCQIVKMLRYDEHSKVVYFISSSSPALQTFKEFDWPICRFVFSTRAQHALLKLPRRLSWPDWCGVSQECTAVADFWIKHCSCAINCAHNFALRIESNDNGSSIRGLMRKNEIRFSTLSHAVSCPGNDTHIPIWKSRAAKASVTFDGMNPLRDSFFVTYMWRAVNCKGPRRSSGVQRNRCCDFKRGQSSESVGDDHGATSKQALSEWIHVNHDIQ